MASLFGKDAQVPIANALEQWLQKYEWSDNWISQVEEIMPRLPDGEGITLKNLYREMLKSESENRRKAESHIRALQAAIDLVCKTKFFKTTSSSRRIDTQRLKSQVDMVDLVACYIDLKRSGKSYRGKCPFHDDNNPSLHVYHDGAHCFACGWHGDHYKFVMEIENVDFPTALTVMTAKSL